MSDNFNVNYIQAHIRESEAYRRGMIDAAEEMERIIQQMKPLEDPQFRHTGPQTLHVHEDLARMVIKQICAIYKTLEDTRDGLLREHTAHREKEDRAYSAEEAKRHRANAETVRSRIQYIDDLLDELEETGPIRRGMED